MSEGLLAIRMDCMVQVQESKLSVHGNGGLKFQIVLGALLVVELPNRRKRDQTLIENPKPTTKLTSGHSTIPGTKSGTNLHRTQFKNAFTCWFHQAGCSLILRSPERKFFF